MMEGYKVEDLPIETRWIVESLRELTAEIRAFREAWEKSPHQDIGALMLANMKAQMQGGIVPAGGILKPGH